VRQKLLAPNSHFRLNKQERLLWVIFIALLIFVGIFTYFNRWVFLGGGIKKESVSKLGQLLNIPTPTPAPTPTPTPKPLTFAEMNALYGPCVRLPVLMYHHVQTEDAAKADKQTGLTTYTDFFQKQMQYLKDKGYNTANMNDLINFFDSGTQVPAKSVLLTFDDGYEDFYTDAYPILQSFGFKATMFVPTGLINNPDYLNWDQIISMNGLVLFANHTWSHKNVEVSTATMQYEISTADTQLADHGLNSPKVFAYPYGLGSNASVSYLNSLGYKAAFTTVPGNILCKKQRFSLPRIRIGSISLSSYGF
jgi:peptidoglycan/xylan/chitin deacetylase (PgdA/CDA1 family)